MIEVPLQHGPGLGTFGASHRTTGTEYATGRRVHGGRQIPFQDLDGLAALHVRIRDGHCRHQRLGIGVQGVREDLLAGAEFHRVAQVHHQHPIRDVLHHGEVVGDEDEGEPHLLLQGFQQVHHLSLDGDIQRRDRLVTDDHLGLEDERPGDADALALAAGELMGVTVHQVRQQTHLGHHGAHLLLHLFPWQGRVEGDEGLGDDVAYGHAGVQGGQRVLEDHLDLLALLPQGVLLELG